MKLQSVGSFVAGAALVGVAVGFTFVGSRAQEEPTMVPPQFNQPQPGMRQGQMMPMQPNFRPMMGPGLQMAANANSIFFLQGSRLIKVDAATLRVTAEREIPQLRGPMPGPDDMGERPPGRAPGRAGGDRPPGTGMSGDRAK